MGTNVLIVDDHPLVGWAVKHLVEQQPDLSVCGTVSSVQEAIDFLEHHTPDLIILDLLLEDDSGVSVIQKVQELGLQSRILVSSMCEDPVRVSETVRLGVAGFVDKGLPLGDLLQSIRRVIAGEYAISDKIQKLCVDAMRHNDDQPGPTQELTGLSEREMEIFGMMGEHQNAHEIASQLGIAIKTVHTHRQNIRQKLGLRSMAELYGRAAVFVSKNTESEKQFPDTRLKIHQNS